MFNEEKEQLDKFLGYLRSVSISEHYVLRIANQLGISDLMLKVLVYLKTNPNGVRRTDLLEFFDIDSGNFVRVMKRYSDKAYVEEKDRLLFITDAGNKVLNDLHDVIISMQTKERPYEDYLRTIETTRHFR